MKVGFHPLRTGHPCGSDEFVRKGERNNKNRLGIFSSGFGDSEVITGCWGEPSCSPVLECKNVMIQDLTLNPLKRLFCSGYEEICYCGFHRMPTPLSQPAPQKKPMISRKKSYQTPTIHCTLGLYNGVNSFPAPFVLSNLFDSVCKKPSLLFTSAARLSGIMPQLESLGISPPPHLHRWFGLWFTLVTSGWFCISYANSVHICNQLKLL